MYVLKGDHVEVVKYLLENDAKVGSVSRDYWLEKIVYYSPRHYITSIKAYTVDEAGIAPIDLTKSDEIKVIDRS